ncbi:MAG: hypothetical protein Q9224_007149, partial [Gallowayella concinna]
SRARPQFVQASVSNLALYERHAQELFFKLEPGPNGWTDVTDLQPLFFHLTLDATTEFFYGQSCYSQNGTAKASPGNAGGPLPPHSKIFTNCVDVATDWVGAMGVLGPWYKYAPARHFKRSRAKIYEFVDWYVKRAVDRASEKSSTEAAEPSRFVVLDELAKLTDDKLWLRNETISLLTGGRSTSAALLSWMFYYLGRNPPLFQKLRQSVIQELGSDYEEENYTASQLRAAHYLKTCMYEILRLSAPTHTTTRSAARDTTLPQGGGPAGKDPVFIPKGTTVLIQIFLLHHRADIWGEDVDEFKPERWDRFDRGWEFIPFGGGPRACVGHFALTETAHVIVRMLQRYDDIQLIGDTEKVTYCGEITNKCGNGVHVKLHRAQGT